MSDGSTTGTRTRSGSILVRTAVVLALLLALGLAVGVFGIGGASADVTAEGTSLYVSPTGSDAGSNNCQTPTLPCQNIDYAIGKAVDGDIIVLNTGVFTQPFTVTKGVTILPNTGASPVIQPSGSWASASSMVTVTASNVTIRDVVFVGPTAYGAAGQFTALSIGTSGSQVTGTQVLNTRFEFPAVTSWSSAVTMATGIAVGNQVSGTTTISGSTFLSAGAYGYRGVVIDASTNTESAPVVRNNSFSGNVQRGIVTLEPGTEILTNTIASTLVPTNTWNVTNTMAYEAVGVMTDSVKVRGNAISGGFFAGAELSGGAITSTVISLNTFTMTAGTPDAGAIRVASSVTSLDGTTATNNAFVGSLGITSAKASVALNAQANWWGTENGPRVLSSVNANANPGADVSAATIVTGAVSYNPWWGMNSVMTSTEKWVAGGIATTDYLGVISDAIHFSGVDAAEPIRVMPGVYSQTATLPTLSIDKQVIIYGKDATHTADVTLLGTISSTNSLTGVVSIDANSVSFSGFKLEGYTFYTNTAETYAGYLLAVNDKTGVAISNNAFYVTPGANDVISASLGITTTGNVNGLVINGNTFTNKSTSGQTYGYQAINLAGGDLTASGAITISNNTVSDYARWGIGIGELTQGSVKVLTNTINSTLVPSYTTMITKGAEAVVISGTESLVFQGNSIGVGSTTNGFNVGLLINNTANNSSVVSNTFNMGAGQYALKVASTNAGTPISVYGNAFVGKGLVNNADGKVLNAAKNWWGAAMGPTVANLTNYNNPRGAGAVISQTGSARVYYSPWWGDNYVGNAHTSPWTWYVNDSLWGASNTVNGLGSIDQGLGLASNTVVDTINVLDHVTGSSSWYTMTDTIAKSVNLVGYKDVRVDSVGSGSSAGYGFLIFGAKTVGVQGFSFSPSSGSTAIGIYVPNGATLNASLNRFVGNSYGVKREVMSSSGAANVANNWWGCNEGPTMFLSALINGCDRYQGAGITTSPYLVVTDAAIAPTTIGVGATVTGTANLVRNSDGVTMTGSVVDFDWGAVRLVDGYGGEISSNGWVVSGAAQVTGTVTGSTVGTYPVAMYVDNYSYQTNYTVYGAPIPSFTPYTGWVNVPITFTNTTTNGVDAANGQPVVDPNNTYVWSFGDGFTSTLMNPTHTYTQAKAYTVVMTATNGGTPVSTDNKTLTVYSAPYIEAITVLAPSVTPVRPGTYISFTSGVTTAPSDDDASVRFVFNPTGSSPAAAQASNTISNLFTTPGYYTASVYAYNAAGSSALTTTVISVTGCPVASLTPTSAKVSLPVTFTIDAPTDPLTATTTYVWQFPTATFTDTGVAVGVRPSHTYTFTAAGTVPVTVTATNATGCAVTTVNNVSVYNDFTPDFTSNTPWSMGVPVQFTNTTALIPSGSDVTGFTWQWLVDGVLASTAKNPSLTFATAGSHTVMLIATAPGAVAKSVSHDVMIYAAPTAAFTTSSPDYLGFATSFTNGSTTNPAGGTGMTFQWNFGDGTAVSATTSPTHTYAATGTYTVIMTATHYALTSVMTGTVVIEPYTVFKAYIPIVAKGYTP